MTVSLNVDEIKAIIAEYFRFQKMMFVSELLK